MMLNIDRSTKRHFSGVSLTKDYTVNSCDKCSAPCCKILHIPEINKNHSTVCKHLSNNRCKIYKSRPKTCQDFKCLYLTNKWSKKYHPDNCGLLFAGLPPGGQFRVRVFQTKNEPLNQDAQEILALIVQMYPTQVMEFEEFKSAKEASQ